MKKIIAIAFAAILAGLAISCQKEEAVSDKADAVQYTFNITVNDRAGFDNDASTKGSEYHKSYWENGDKIFLFFKPTTDNNLLNTYATLTYDGSEWGVNAPGLSGLGEDGTLSAVYVYNLDGNVYPEFSSADNQWTIATGNTFYNCQTGVDYTVSDNVISASINLVAPTDFVRFYVEGATGALTCNNVKGWKDIAIGSDMAISNVTYTGYMDGFDNSGDSNVKEYYGRIVNNGTSLKDQDCEFSVVKLGKVYERTATPTSDARSFYMEVRTDGDKPWIEAKGKLPGLFTVGKGADGKAGTADDVKVRFSKGNLWAKQSPDKDEMYFEENQYSSKSDWDPDHLSLLTWSSTAREAANIGYSGDNLFCDVNHKVSVDGSEAIYYALSLDEWKYLINKDGDENIRKGKYKYGVTVCLKAKCLILVPDECLNGYSFDSAKTSYTVGEWATAEAAGLVCLPAAGYRSEMSFNDEGYYGYYWSSNNNEFIDRQAYLGVKFDGSSVDLGDPAERDYGYSIRLVTEVK
ncbi:MAG: fibrobacter succinogenes major paralogous domain-containing protein [Bacteroidales bacterium]|nr:fibrobacter succinogenes major paralogous domain-containing protein [Bacteroidales bacterium]